MDDSRQMEADLLCMVLEAIPCPAALLSRDGFPVYTNSRPCPISLEEVDYSAIPEVQRALKGADRQEIFLTLRLRDAEAGGYLEACCLRDSDRIAGALVLFNPGKASPMEGKLRKMRGDFDKERISSVLAAYGDSVEDKRRAAAELGIGLSTLYRLLAKQENPHGEP